MKKLSLFLSILFFVSFQLQSQSTDQKLYPVKVNGKWGYINEHGKIIIKPQFDEALEFSEGFAGVLVNKKWGFIDNTGDLFIKPTFKEVGKFSEGLARVKIKDEWGFIDNKGNIIVKPEYYEVTDFKNGYAKVNNGKLGEPSKNYINKNGLLVLEWHSGLGNFSEDYIAFEFDGKWGYMFQFGKVVIQPRYNGASDFSEGLASVYVYNLENNEIKYSYINKRGQVVIKPMSVDYADSFSEGLAAIILNYKCGYIDKTGKYIVEPKYDLDNNRASKFVEGMAKVRLNNKYGFIDKTGNLVINTEFLDAGNFSEGLAYVKDKFGKYGYINKQGNWVIKPIFDSASEFKDGISKVFLGYKMGYIDKTGKFIWEPSE